MPRAALVTPMSGPLARYGVAGAQALTLWAERFAGAPALTLTVYDAHPDPAAAVARAEQDGTDLLFGPYGSSPAVIATRAAHGLLWNHGGARLGPQPNAVSILAPASTYFAGAIQVVRNADPTLRRVAILRTGTGFASAVADGAAASAVACGLDAVVGALPVTEPPEAGLLLVVGAFDDELAAAGRLLPGRWRAAGFVGAGTAEVFAELGARRAGLLGPAQWLAAAAEENPDAGPPAGEFAEAFRRRFCHEPSYPAAQAFAAGIIAARCLDEAGPDPAALLEAARRLDCTTLFGRFRLDPLTGEQIGHQVLTVQWQDGERVAVWPPERASAALRYPLPG